MIAPCAVPRLTLGACPVALSLSTGEVILIIVLAAIPIALAHLRARAPATRFDQIGKGQFAVEFDSDLPPAITDDSAAAPRRRPARPRSARCSRRRPTGSAPAARRRSTSTPSSRGCSSEPRRRASRPTRSCATEVRQLVVARNERRVRQGKEPLDVDAEVERQLRELENLGQ